MSATGSEVCQQIKMHPPKFPGTRKAAQRRQEEDCQCVYIGETGRTLEKQLSEHKNGVKKNDTKNGIAVHSWTKQHQVDWEAAKTIEVEGNYWRRRVLEALHIHQLQQTSNLDCGLTINPSWLPVLNQPSPP